MPEIVSQDQDQDKSRVSQRQLKRLICFLLFFPGGQELYAN